MALIMFFVFFGPVGLFCWLALKVLPEEPKKPVGKIVRAGLDSNGEQLYKRV